MKYEHAARYPAEVEFRAIGNEWQFSGYAAIFESESDPRLGFIETVAPSAFNRSLQAKTHSFVVDHNDGLLLSTERSRRLQLSVDSKGLLTESKLPDTTYARDLQALHEAGETSGMSFNFKPTRGGVQVSQHSSGLQARRLIDVHLGHVTILTASEIPAYPATATEYAFRSLAEALQAEPDDLEALFDAITLQRALTEPQTQLLARLATHYAPATEPEPIVTTSDEQPQGRSIDEWKALLTDKGVIAPV